MSLKFLSAHFQANGRIGSFAIVWLDSVGRRRSAVVYARDNIQVEPNLEIIAF